MRAVHKRTRSCPVVHATKDQSRRVVTVATADGHTSSPGGTVQDVAREAKHHAFRREKDRR